MASYKEGQKDGPWRIWSDKGKFVVWRCSIRSRKKSCVWRTTDEEGNLLSEENQ